MTNMIKVNNWHWRVPDFPDIVDGINDNDRIIMTPYNRLELEKKIISGNNIHYVRWIKSISTWSIDLANKYRYTERGWTSPFLWQDELPEWLVRKICKSNWKFYKYIINPTYKIKKDYFELMNDKKYIKKNNIDVFLYELYKPSWDEKEQEIKNKINSRR